MTSLVGIGCTRPQVGKSTFASHLKAALEQRGKTARVIPFAEAVKSTLMHLLLLLGIEDTRAREYLYGSAKEQVIPELGVTGRYLMVSFASGWGRDAVNKDLWVMIARAQILRTLDAGGFVIVDDVRLPNEYDLIKQLGGLTVRIDRPQSLVEAKYSSDVALNGVAFDVEYCNDGELDQLRAYVEKLADQLVA